MSDANWPLDVEARKALYDAMRGIKSPTEHALNMTEAHRVLLAIGPVVAALVSQAREAGAAEERERIAREIQIAEMTYEGYENTEHYRGGYMDGLGHAADIARGNA